MLVSHRKKFIFIKTQKTASTSVECYFEYFCVPDGDWEFEGVRRESSVTESGIIGYRGKYPFLRKWSDHSSASRIKSLIGDSIWNEYLKFCVVRNPFDKLVSAFHFFESMYDQKQLDFYKLMHLPNVLRRSQNRNLPTPTRFRKWLPANIRKLVDREKYFIDGQVCVDHFIRFESLLTGIQAVCDRVHAAYWPDRLKKLVTSERPDDLMIRDYYDSESIALVEKHFDFELNEFEYKIPD